MMRSFLIFYILTAFIQSSFASEYITLFNKNEEYSKVLLTEKINSFGIKEVRGDATGFPRFLKGLNPTLFYGRDLNQNGKMDTWFFLKENGVEVIVKEGNQNLGQDILPELLKTHFQTSAKMYFTTSTITILSYLFFTANEAQVEKNQFYADWINLEELNLRIISESKNPSGVMNQEQLNYQRELLNYGFLNLHQQLDKFQSRDIFGYIAADIGMWLGGGIVIKWGGKLLSTPIKMLSETSVYKFLSENIAKFFETQKEIIASRIESTASKIEKGKEKTKKNILKLTPKNWGQKLKFSLNAMNVKTRLLQGSNSFLKGVHSEWRYIVLNSSIQSIAEGASRFNEIKDPNPLVMAKNLFTNPEVQQNMGFMALDTVLMTGVSKNLKTFKTRFMASAFIAITNSTLINVFIKKENDINRIAVDTSWEALIGNGQVQLDLMALSYFEQLGSKMNNPNLKLLGYAVVLIDQGAGYYTYSKVSERSDQVDDKLKKVLVPIIEYF